VTQTEALQLCIHGDDGFQGEQARRPVGAAPPPRVAAGRLPAHLPKPSSSLPAVSSRAVIGYRRLPPLSIASIATSDPSIHLHENMPCRLATTYAILNHTETEITINETKLSKSNFGEQV
jgi:hypothetical protein